MSNDLPPAKQGKTTGIINAERQANTGSLPKVKNSATSIYLRKKPPRRRYEIILALAASLGAVYFVANSFAPTVAKARSLMKKGDVDGGLAMLSVLAERRNCEALKTLAAFHFEGKLIPCNVPRGIHYLELAAYHGDVEAQVKMADLCAQDGYRAAAFLMLAADSGEVASMCRLGKMFYFGEDVHADYGKAKKYLEMAAAAGDISATGLLGQMQYQGQGMPSDREKGLAKLRLAAGKGDAAAGEFLHTVEEAVADF